MSIAHCLKRVKGLSQSQLRSDALQLVRATSQKTAELIAHLAEIAERKAYLPKYNSMWSYCVGGLDMAEGEAHVRIQVAKACGRHPELLEAIHSHRMSLTVASKVIPCLKNDENRAEIIRSARL